MFLILHTSAVTVWILLVTALASQQSSDTPEAGSPKLKFPLLCRSTCPWTNETDLVDYNQVADGLDTNLTVANATNLQVVKSPNVWCDGIDFQEPLVKMKLPPCKNITLAGAEFTITIQGTVKVSGKNWGQEFQKFSLSENNTTVSVCFRLSPQLLQCGLKRLDPRLYSYNTSLKALQNCREPSDVISMRDYFTSPDSNDVIGCEVPIGNDRGLRCNDVVMDVSDVELARDNSSILILSSKVVINWPEFSMVDATHIKLCYPMTAEMTTCGLWAFKQYEFSITADHRLFSPSYNRHYDPGEYVLPPGGGALLCKPKNQVNAPPDPFFRAMAIVQIVSAVFMALALVIHIVVPSLNYHAKPLLCHMSSTAVMYICASVRRLVTVIPTKGCYTLFVFYYYSAMTSFFWISVLAFDLWSIFAGMQASSKMSCAITCDKGRKFAYYALYAYGVPLLLVIFSVVVDALESLQDALGLHPDIRTMCWFNERKSALAFCYIPLIIVFAANIVLFVMTVFNLRHATKDVKIVNKKRNKQLLFVCIKIFCIMGLFSIIELVTVMVDATGTGVYAAEISSASQGIILFIIYICKPATYRVLRKKFWPSSSTATGNSKSNNRDSTNSGISMESVIPDEITPNQKKNNLSESSEANATDKHNESVL